MGEWVSDDLLEFGDESWEEAKGTVLTTLRSLHRDLNGNGKQGIKADMTEVKQDLTEIKAYGRASAFWGKVLAGLLGLLIGGATLYIAYFEAHHHISEIQSTQSQQNAATPNMK